MNGNRMAAVRGEGEEGDYEKGERIQTTVW